MQIFKKSLLGTVLEIGILDQNIDHSILEEIFSLVQNFEHTYSRFIKGNYLWNLNHSKKAPLTSEIATILNLAKKLNILSQGYFDITVLPYLEKIGYGNYSGKDEEISYGMENIILTNNEIILENDISIDFGGLGKGYMIDVIFHELKNHFSRFVINFGGDIRVAGQHTFSLEDPINPKKFLGKIKLNTNALAGSAGNKRKTAKGHHLINIKTGHSENKKLAVYTTHKIASFADGFATTLFVSPLEISLKILEQVPGLEGIIITKDNKIYRSKNFNLQKT